MTQKTGHVAYKSDDANISAEIVEICGDELFNGFMATNTQTKTC